MVTYFIEIDYLDRCSKIFYEEHVGEELMKPFISYSDTENKYLIQVIDLRHQVDHINPTKTQLFKEYRNDPVYPNIRIFVILIRHRQIKMISDGDKIIEFKVF